MFISIRIDDALAILCPCLSAGTALAAADRTNIVVIMGDDIGMWNIGAHHRSLMAGRTPSIAILRSFK